MESKVKSEPHVIVELEATSEPQLTTRLRADSNGNTCVDYVSLVGSGCADYYPASKYCCDCGGGWRLQAWSSPGAALTSGTVTTYGTSTGAGGGTSSSANTDTQPTEQTTTTSEGLPEGPSTWGFFKPPSWIPFQSSPAASRSRGHGGAVGLVVSVVMFGMSVRVMAW